MNVLVVATRIFLGLIFFSAGLAKLTHGLTPGLIGRCGWRSGSRSTASVSGRSS